MNFNKDNRELIDVFKYYYTTSEKIFDELGNEYKSSILISFLPISEINKLFENQSFFYFEKIDNTLVKFNLLKQGYENIKRIFHAVKDKRLFKNSLKFNIIFSKFFIILLANPYNNKIGDFNQICLKHVLEIFNEKSLELQHEKYLQLRSFISKNISPLEVNKCWLEIQRKITLCAIFYSLRRAFLSVKDCIIDDVEDLYSRSTFYKSIKINYEKIITKELVKIEAICFKKGDKYIYEYFNFLCDKCQNILVNYIHLINCDCAHDINHHIKCFSCNKDNFITLNKTQYYYLNNSNIISVS